MRTSFVDSHSLRAFFLAITQNNFSNKSISTLEAVKMEIFYGFSIRRTMTRLIKSIFTNNETVHHVILTKEESVAAGESIYQPSKPITLCWRYNLHNLNMPEGEETKKKNQIYQIPKVLGFLHRRLEDNFVQGTDNKRRKVHMNRRIPGCGKNFGMQSRGVGLLTSGEDHLQLHEIWVHLSALLINIPS